MSEDHDWYAKYRREVEKAYAKRRIDIPHHCRQLNEHWERFRDVYIAQRNTRLP